MPIQNTGDEISKAAVLQRFNEVMRDNINPVIDVGSGTPFTTGTYRELTNTGDGGIPINHVGAPTVSPATTGGLTDTIIDAAGLANYLRTLTRNYSQVRKLNWRLRFNKTGYPSGNGNLVLEQTTTDYIHLNAETYKQTVTDNATTYNIEEGDLIDASDFESYIADLYSQWSTLKENTVTIYVDTCHASCHSNCHGSRGRR
jgi:hypothetical protein